MEHRKGKVDSLAAFFLEGNFLKNFRFVSAVFFLGFLAVSLTTCGKGGGGPAVVSLVSISVTPVNLVIPVGATQQFKATGAYSDGTSQNVTAQVTWSSSNPSLATVSSSGLATAVAAGTTTIAVTLGSISGGTSLTVTSATLSSILVMSANSSIPIGVTQQFTATGTYSDGTSFDVTAQVTWSSSNPSLATVSGSGLATAVAAGTATITATSGNISGSTSLTVISATLSSILVTSANSSIPIGVTQQFKATGAYSDGTSHDITMQATWNSSNTLVATVSSSGLATAVAAGTATITATSGISGGTSLTVTSATLSSILVTSANSSIPVGGTQQFTATGTYSDKTRFDITPQVTWISSNPSVTVVNGNGLATAISAGAAAITATIGSPSISGNTGLGVISATLSSIAITPINPSIPVGLTSQFRGTGTYSDGISRDITRQATWSSSNPLVVVVNSNGLAIAISAGTATITVSSGNISVSTAFTVTTATLSSILVTPGNRSIPFAGVTSQFTATGTYSDGTSFDVTTEVTWNSANPSVAVVNSNGLAITISAGTATITATSGTISGNATLTVAAAAILSSITVTPANPSVHVGFTPQFTATGTYSDGTTQNITTQVTWSSSNPSVATVSSSGLATAVAAGTTTITATSGTLSGNTALTVT